MAVKNLFRRPELTFLMRHNMRPIRDFPEAHPKAVHHPVGLFEFLIIQAKCLLSLFCRFEFMRKSYGPGPTC